MPATYNEQRIGGGSHRKAHNYADEILILGEESRVACLACGNECTQQGTGTKESSTKSPSSLCINQSFFTRKEVAHAAQEYGAFYGRATIGPDIQVWRRTQRVLRAARSSVQYWRSLYEDIGEHGLMPRRRGRSAWKASDDVLTALIELLQSTPRERGFLRSRWSYELLALELRQITGVEVHATTVRRWLKELNCGYRRARPTLCIRDPRKAERMKAIERALADDDPGTSVFYSDEADVDLNPRIGPAWMPRATQSASPRRGRTKSATLPVPSMRAPAR